MSIVMGWLPWLTSAVVSFSLVLSLGLLLSVSLPRSLLLGTEEPAPLPCFLLSVCLVACFFLTCVGGDFIIFTLMVERPILRFWVIALSLVCFCLPTWIRLEEWILELSDSSLLSLRSTCLTASAMSISWLRELLVSMGSYLVD